MKPQCFIFMGRYGAGKGTQAQLLIKYLQEKDSVHPCLHIETGAEFRAFTKGDGYTARLTKDTIDTGRLMPEYMCVYLWGRRLCDAYTGNEHIIFDGTPRKSLEARMLDGLFPFYGLPKPYVVYLDVGHDESHKRITLRSRSSGRADDAPTAIEKRKVAYETDIVPTIDYYRTDPNVIFLDIPGERSIEEIHADIVRRIDLK